MKSVRERFSFLGITAVLLLGSTLAPPAQATLLGSTVDISLVRLSGLTLTELSGADDVVVISGAEVTGINGAFNIDIGAMSIRIDVFDGGPIPPAGFLGFLFESIDSEVLGFNSIGTNIAELTNSRLSFGPDAVSVDFQGLTLARGDFVDIGLQFAVNAPATPALLAAGGVLLVAGSRRSRRRRAAAAPAH